jgi:hypothetical protein
MCASKSYKVVYNHDDQGKGRIMGLLMRSSEWDKAELSVLKMFTSPSLDGLVATNAKFANAVMTQVTD